MFFSHNAIEKLNFVIWTIVRKKKNGARFIRSKGCMSKNEVKFKGIYSQT